METKKELRKKMIMLRNAISDEAYQSFAVKSRKRLVEMPKFLSSNSVMLYMDFRKEAPTLSLIDAVIAHKKELILPFTDTSFKILPYKIPLSKTSSLKDIYDFMAQSPMGIWEPDPMKAELYAPSKIDFVIVPGVAFDKSGNRLGYGRGCYDEFLPKLNLNTPKLALSYDFQVLDFIPCNEYDVKLDGFL